MAQDKPARRPRAETPKGFRDYFGAEVTERKQMLDKVAAVYHLYGFDPLETSAVETVEALGKFLPDVDRPNEGVFGWQDEDADWLALAGIGPAFWGLAVGLVVLWLERAGARRRA